MAKIKKKALSQPTPKTSQESIPYVAVYANGIIETVTGKFTKSYFIGDCNFSISSENDQENIFGYYQKFLNMFSPGVNFEISLFNRKVDQQKVVDDIMIKHNRSDGLDEYRDEINGIVLNKMHEGKNDLVKEKYLTVSVEADGIDEAVNLFNRIDLEVATAFAQISDKEVVPMSVEERLNVFYDIYNSDSPVSFTAKAQVDNKTSEFFDLGTLYKHGITSKDLIAPAFMEFKPDHIILGDKYVRVLYVENYPTTLSTNFLSDITNTSFNLLTSITYEPLHPEKTMKMLSNQLTNINANIIESQKRASRSGYSTGIISPSLQRSKEETTKLMDDITAKNQKVFYATVLFAVYGNDLQELNDHTHQIITTASKYLVSVKKLSWQQEYGFNQCLPLSDVRLSVQRMFTTEAAALFLPFSALELSQKNGIYYGVNAVTKNLILYNRSNANNTSAMFLGTPGSGKSFLAKSEMLNVILNTNDDVYIIDPEREYAGLASMLGGEVIKLDASGNNHINLFDMDLDYDGESSDPLSSKVDYIITVCETIMGRNSGLTAMQKSIIDRCVKNIYRPYMDYMKIQKSIGYGTDIDRSRTPTLVDFYKELLAQDEPEARNIALAIELYSVGSLNTFAHKTNVDTNRRLVVYDIKDMQETMKEVGLHVALNDIWNKTIANKKKGKRTWFYIDEFYLLTQTDSSARFLQRIFKRARKWGGCPTGITQNVEDMLVSREARTIISNCDFVVMLNQSPIDGADLGDMFHISETQMTFITNSPPGQGLIYTGRAIIPFVNKYPENTKTFRVMTTKFGG